MIVLGADMHKRSHTIAAVAATTGELLGEQTVEVGARGFAARCWVGRAVWAASGSGRWRTAGMSRARLSGSCSSAASASSASRRTLMAGERRGGRDRGKSDRIDAIAVARAALREGLDRLPAASWPAPSSTSGCWSITANGSSGCASRSTTTCSGTCTTSGPS